MATGERGQNPSERSGARWDRTIDALSDTTTMRYIRIAPWETARPDAQAYEATGAGNTQVSHLSLTTDRKTASLHNERGDETQHRADVIAGSESTCPALS